jgi:hypothetical protein
MHISAVTAVAAILFKVYAAEAGSEQAEEPMEEAGMSEDVIQKVTAWTTCFVIKLLLCY